MVLNAVSARGGTRDKTVKYVYQDNKQLVRLVEDAATLIEQKGRQALAEFAIQGSKWFTDKHYLFVYDDAGTCLFHPEQPGLQGQNLSQFKDMEGKPVIAIMLEIIKQPQSDASGWVFYLWDEPGNIHPIKKGSYVRKAISPEGKAYLVGSGLYGIKIERVFIRESVDRAAALIQTRGKDAAFAELMSPISPLHVMDSYILVTDQEGNVLVDPLYPNLPKKRNISRKLDLIGRNVFLETKEALRDSESTWSTFTVPKAGSGLPEKYLIYTRKVQSGDDLLFVVASFVPASPIWIK